VVVVLALVANVVVKSVVVDLEVPCEVSYVVVYALLVLREVTPLVSKAVVVVKEVVLLVL